MVLEKGTLVNDRYRIIEQIGVGGMAIVYRAKDEKLDRDVTFKVLKKDFINDEEFISRFSTEARAAARLSNTNIVNVYDVGNDGDIHYIVMEYIDGFTLKDLIKSKAPFTNEEAAGIAIQIATALEHAHSNDIVHRDIKPENILISREGKAGTVKVTDFGIAKATSAATSPIDCMGSVHYFSPEQAKGKHVDSRSDIYSLGIVLFEMVTGQLPYTGETAVELAMKHLQEPLPDIKQLNPNVSDEMVAIIKKATCKEPKNRYQSVDEMAEALKIAVGLANADEIKRAKRRKENEEARLKEEKKKAAEAKRRKQEEELEEEEYHKKEKTVIIAALITGIVIILAITIGGRFLNKALYGDTVKVPDFVGMDYDKACVKAENLGLTIEKQEIYKESVGENEVADQSPEGGERVEPGETVILFVSSSSSSIEVPDFVDKLKSSVDVIAEKSGLIISAEYVHSDKAQGTVVSQEPEAGEKVAVGATIKIKVSEGGVDEYVSMPDVRGKTKDEAVSILAEVGLTPKLIDGYSDTVEVGKIIDQGVQPNDSAAKGSQIMLTVSMGANAVTQEPVEITTLTPVVSLPSEKPEPTTAAEATTAASHSESAKTKDVSVPVSPDKTTLKESGNTVKIVAKNSSGERVVKDGTYSASDFPFSVNRNDSSDTTYEVYVNDNLIATAK